MSRAALSGGTLPPLTTTPTFFPAKSSLCFSTVARASAPDGSATIFARSQSSFKASVISSSVALRTPFACSLIISRLRCDIGPPAPSAIDFPGCPFLMIYPLLKDSSASLQRAGTAP